MTITPASDPINASEGNEDGEPIDADEEYGDIELNKNEVVISNVTKNMVAILVTIVAIIA
jgi:hypothetical protein